MFGLFKKKDPIEKLQDKYRKLLAESHSLSQRDRRAGDEKMAEAEEVAKEIDRLKSQKN